MIGSVPELFQSWEPWYLSWDLYQLLKPRAYTSYTLRIAFYSLLEDVAPTLPCLLLYQSTSLNGVP